MDSEEFKHVVILCPDKPTNEEFSKFSLIPIEMLSIFPHVYVIIGDPHKRKYLEAAGVLYAETVVVMKMKSDDPDLEEDFVDSSAMMVSHIIYDLFVRAGIRKQTIIDLDSSGNIKFLRPTSKKLSNRQSRQSLQANSADSQVLQDPHYAPIFAAGGVLCYRMLESILYQQYFQPSVSEVIRAFCGISYVRDQRHEKIDGMKSSRIFMVKCPFEFIGQPYERLYYALARHMGIIPLGILRNEISNSLGNVLPFVLTNPMPSMLLRSGDLVYILAKPEQIS